MFKYPYMILGYLMKLFQPQRLYIIKLDGKMAMNAEEIRTL
jgi:hypothetical protein